MDGFIIVHFQLPIADFLLKPCARFFVSGFFLKVPSLVSTTTTTLKENRQLEIYNDLTLTHLNERLSISPKSGVALGIF